MRVACTTLALGGVVSFMTGIASAQDPLTMADVLSRARARAPEIVSARLAIEEARGRLAGASLRVQANPEVDIGIGSRQGGNARSTALEFGVAQTFEPARRRSARMAGASAGLDGRTATADETIRVVLQDAATTFHEAVYAAERIRLLASAEQLAARVLDATDRRFRSGELAVLDVNIARASLARTRADREGAEASQVEALGRLRVLLGLDAGLSVAGDLSLGPEVDLQALMRASAERPEIRALEAAVREADAEAQLGRTFSKPEYGFAVRYQREEGDQIVLGGVTLTLPVFSKGQELQAIGSARASRLRVELDAARTRVQVELGTAIEASQRRVRAARVLEGEALPGLDENETLATRSFEVGQLGLPDLLLIRREIFETRFQHLDTLLEAALARVAVDASAAVLR